MQPLFQQKSNNYYIFQKCVSVALFTQHAMHMFRFVICDLSGSNIFFHITSSVACFLKKANVTANKMYVSIFFTSFV